MKLLLALTLLTALPAAAQTPFKQNELMTIGSYYYPEQWPRENWARDS